MLANTSFERIGQELESRKSKQYWKPNKEFASMRYLSFYFMSFHLQIHNMIMN